MNHLVKHVFRQLGNIRIAVISRIADRNRDDFIVGRAVVEHRNNPNRIALHKRHRLDLLGAEYQHIQRVVVERVSARNKAVIRRVVGGSMQHAVEMEHAGLFVELIFHFAALADFNDGVKRRAGDARRVDVMPNVHLRTPLYSSIKRLRISQSFSDKST